MELQKLINRAMDLRGQYEKKETELYGSPATDEDIAQGFSGDVNNLIKLIMAERGKRTIANSKYAPRVVGDRGSLHPSLAWGLCWCSAADSRLHILFRGDATRGRNRSYGSYKTCHKK